MSNHIELDGDDWRLRHFTVKLGDVYWRMGFNKATTKAEAREIPPPTKGEVFTKVPDHKEIWPEAYDENGVHYLHHYLSFCGSG